MLHELLLSLAGYPSPLLRAHNDSLGTDAAGDGILSPPERQLLATLASLSEVHIKLVTLTAQIRSSHTSPICRAVATAIDSIHLAAFHQKVLQVEDTILCKDAGLVGAYDIVPLTAVVGEFTGWTRRIEWLWDLARYMVKSANESRQSAADQAACTGAKLIDRLRAELQTGYVDIGETAQSLVRVAETAWLKQVSAWMLYGKLPSFGGDDFFVQQSDEGEEEFVCVSALLPAFVTPQTASSMVFVGSSLNQIRVKSRTDSALHGVEHLSSELKEFRKLTYPLDSAMFSDTVAGIRQHLSRTVLQKLLPLAKVMELLDLLRGFFLLGRGEFAAALTQQADEKLRGRWRRADNLAYEKRDGLDTVVVKEGEVSAVLNRTWAALSSLQGHHGDEDEGLEFARDLVHLAIPRAHSATPLKFERTSIASTPFRNLLFSVPVVMTLDIPSPQDLFLSASDVHLYTCINSYLLSIRRANIRLTDLWKISPLRRHHPPPPGPPYGSSRSGREKVRLLRQRHTTRSRALRSAWATSSAAIFFLSETEAYLQTEVVAGLWDGFHQWLVRGEDPQKRIEQSKSLPQTKASASIPASDGEAVESGDENDVWLTVTAAAELRTDGRDGQIEAAPGPRFRDPQTLATAHRLYLRTMARRLLLTEQTFTDSLYDTLVQIDRLVAFVHRLHGIWTSADLEADVGVVDAFVDLEREEHAVQDEIRSVENSIKRGIEGNVVLLREMEANSGSSLLEEAEGDPAKVEGDEGGFDLEEEGSYRPRRVGGIDRLLMKLDFGSWFTSQRRTDESDDEEG